MGYYIKQALFSTQDEMTGFAHTAASTALYPFVSVVLAVVWTRYTRTSTSFSFEELLRYVGVTELLFLTSLRSAVGGWAQSDFSLSLARPRSWILTHFASFLGRSSAKRIIHLALFATLFPLIGGGDFHSVAVGALRLALLLPILGVVEALYSLLLCALELVVPQSTYLRFLIGKLFLVCGGVIAPLSEVKEPVGELLRSTPWSDVVFQIGSFVVRGHFYKMGVFEWITRVALHLLVLVLIVNALTYLARRQHQAFGG